MEHEQKELRAARRLGAQQAEEEVPLEAAVDGNPYSDPALSQQYWRGYLAVVKKQGRLEDVLEEGRSLAGEYFDAEDTLERLDYLVSFPPGTELYAAFLDSYLYFTEAARDSRFDVMDEIGEDWQPDESLMEMFFDRETDWRDHFYRVMSTSTQTVRPDRLYKFRRLATKEDVSRVTDDILRGHELWFPRASQLNDLFEFKLMLSNDLPAPDQVGTIRFWDVAAGQLDRVWVPQSASAQLMEEMRDRILHSESVVQGFRAAWGVVAGTVAARLTQMRAELGICSFAGNAADRLMWAHYGGDNQGVALGFASQGSFWSGLQRVQYVETPPVFSNALDRLDDVMEEAIFSKHTDWCHEDEWRLVRPPSRKDGQAGVRHFYPKKDLVEVVFGAQTTEGNKRAIRKACETAGLAPRFLEVCQAAGYDLELQEYTRPGRKRAFRA